MPAVLAQPATDGSLVTRPQSLVRELQPGSISTRTRLPSQSGSPSQDVSEEVALLGQEGDGREQGGARQQCCVLLEPDSERLFAPISARKVHALKHTPNGQHWRTSSAVLRSPNHAAMPDFERGLGGSVLVKGIHQEKCRRTKKDLHQLNDAANLLPQFSTDLQRKSASLVIIMRSIGRLG
eukprot:scaffold10128_cov16-Tisochrysis_lutea.AAC.1